MPTASHRLRSALAGPSRLLLLLALLPAPAAAQGTPYLVRDLDDSLVGAGVSDLVRLGDGLFFRGTDSATGTEPWWTDGTPAGTRRIADVRPGPDDSMFADSAARVGDALFFTADDGVHGTELWTSDGSEAGTRLVKDIVPGPQEAFTAAFPRLVAAGGLLFFPVDDGVHGGELWRSDGSEAGTALVADIGPGGAQGVSPFGDDLIESGGRVYFAADDGVHGLELWRSDGTAAGTERVADVAPGPDGSGPDLLLAHGGFVYFAADDGDAGRELWRSDGTEAGTVLVADLLPGPGDGRPDDMVEAGGVLFFTATDAAAGNELWRSDGTAAGTALVKDVAPGSRNSIARELTAVGSRVFFAADDGEHGEELWTSDGTAAGTVLVRDVAAGPSSAQPRELTAVGSALFFRARDADHGVELWTSDGSEAGTTVLDLLPGTGSSGVDDLAALDGFLFFEARFVPAPSLWRSDGTASGTGPHASVNDATRSASPRGLAALDEALLFFARDAQHGQRLWRSDGRADGTQPLADLALPGDASPAVRLGGRIFFAADDGVHGDELWASDGTAAGTERVADLLPGPAGAKPRELVVAGGRIYFTAQPPSGGRALWRSDGTGAGTGVVFADPADPFVGPPAQPTAVGGEVFFLVPQALSGALEIWRSDGAGSGATLVRSLPGPAFLPRVDAAAFGTAALGDRFLLLRSLGRTFSAGIFTLFESEDDLWISDGTEAGTVPLLSPTSIPLQAGGEVGGALGVVGRRAVLAFADGDGREPFATDGTADGTGRLADLRPGPSGSDPEEFTTVGAGAYFSANDGSTGNELWRTDGTAAGTARVADVVPGSQGSFPGRLTAAVADRLFFVPGTAPGSGGSPSSEPWLSDGAGAGTFRLADLRPGVAASNPRHPTAVGPLLFFAADDGRHGEELFAVRVAGCGAVPEPSCQTVPLSVLWLQETPGDTFDTLGWIWNGAPAPEPGALGDPTAGSSYAVCVHDERGRLLSLELPADPERWRPHPRQGFLYHDPTRTADGVESALLRPRGSSFGGSVIGRGANLPDPELPLLPPLTVELLRNDGRACFRDVLDADELLFNTPPLAIGVGGLGP